MCSNTPFRATDPISRYLQNNTSVYDLCSLNDFQEWVCHRGGIRALHRNLKDKKRWWQHRVNKWAMKERRRRDFYVNHSMRTMQQRSDSLFPMWYKFLLIKAKFTVQYLYSVYHTIFLLLLSFFCKWTPQWATAPRVFAQNTSYQNIKHELINSTINSSSLAAALSLLKMLNICTSFALLSMI